MELTNEIIKYNGYIECKYSHVISNNGIFHSKKWLFLQH